MTYLLDPFYAVRHPAIARWLNRLLMLSELGAMGFVVYYFLVYGIKPYWWLIWMIPAMLLGVTIVNLFVRGFWNMIMVIIYGSTDPEEIEEVCDKMDGKSHYAKKDFLLSEPTYIDENGERHRIPQSWE